MPVQSWAHSQYWSLSSTAAPPPNDPIYIASGYPSWQGGVVVGSGFGSVGAWLASLWAQVQWWWQFICRFRALAPRNQGLLVYVLGLLEAASASVATVDQTVAFLAHVQQLSPAEQRLIRTFARLMRDPKWPLAQAAVQRTAHTLGFNRPEAWVPLNRMLKHDRGAQENQFRHLEACRLLRANVIGSTLSNPECHLLTEMAYHAYAQR